MRLLTESRILRWADGNSLLQLNEIYGNHMVITRTEEDNRKRIKNFVIIEQKRYSKMRKHKLIYMTLLCLLFFTSVLFSTAPVTLSELQRPDTITVSGDKIFITDVASVAIYSLKDFSYIKSFGKVGEGPREFKVLPSMGLGLRLGMLADRVLVNSISKVSIFNRDGNFIQEYKISKNIQEFKPVGKKFVGYGTTREDKTFLLLINLYSADFKPEKEIYRKDWYAQTDKEFNPIHLASGVKRRALYQTYDNKIFIEGPRGEIIVFDGNGKQLFTINHNYDAIPITNENKREIMRSFVNSPQLQQVVRNKGIYPENFPPAYFTVTDNRIYVLTYKQKDNKTDFYLFDLKGKFLKKVTVPFFRQSLLFPYPYTVHKGKIYQLVDDEDEEEWLLHINELK